MKKIFICHTEYHVLIALAKNINNEQNGKNDIVLYGTLNNINAIYKKIKKTKIFNNVYIFNYKDIDEINKIPETRNIILRRKILKNMIRTLYNFDFLKNKEIYIFNDNSIIGMYLRMSKINYNLIEDGLDCYKNIERHYNFNSLEYKIRILFDSLTCSFGSSKYVQKIEVNSKENINVFFKGKFVEVPRKEMFAKLNKEEKEAIINVFLDRQIELENKQFSLLITQPLYKDGFLNDESQQLEMYKYIINTYMRGKIVIKPHPRDEIDYSQLSNNYIVLDNRFPIEILNFMDNISINRCVTAFSTSIDALENCNQKIVLGSEWIQKYKNGGINGKK